MQFANVHIGQIIKKGVYDRRKDGNWLSSVMGLKRRSSVAKYDEPYISPEYIRRVSIAFNEDLFIHLLSDETKEILRQAQLPPAPAPEATQDAELARLYREDLGDPNSVAYLRTELARLNLEVQYLKEINQLLRDKNNHLLDNRSRPPIT